MKKILLIGCMAMLALLPRPLHAQPLFPPTPPQVPTSTQSGSGSGGLGDLFGSLLGNLFGSLTTLHQDGPTLEILPMDQPQVIDAPEGVIVPVASITLRGKNGGSDVDGLSVQFRWVREEAPGLEHGATDMGGKGGYRDIPTIPIDGYVLLNGNTPRGPVQTLDYSGKIIMNPVYIGDGNTKTITVGALMKASLAADMGKYFSVRIIDVSTTATVSGTLPVDGGLKSISDVKAGRLGIVGVGGADVIGDINGAYPLIWGQTGMEIRMPIQGQGQTVPMFVVDARCLGGKANDVSVTLRNPSDGKILAGPMQMESSLLYGQGSAKFQFPFHVAKDTIGGCLITYRLGQSWINGGTIAFSVDKSKCIALGDDGFMTIPLYVNIVTGPLIVVLPVATDFGFEQVAEIDTGNQLGLGQNDFAAIEITAPADKPLAIQSLGGWLDWSPNADKIGPVNIYGYILGTTSTASEPIQGLQSSGAFQTEGVDMKGMRGGYEFRPRDTRGNSSAAIIPAGGKGYFVLRGNYTASGPHSKVSAEIFDWNSEETFTLQQKSR